MENGLNINEIMQENARLQTNDNFLDNFVKWPDGNGIIIVRFLPPAKKGLFGNEKNPFFLTTRIHKINGRSYHCPKEFDGKYWKIGRCPICDYYNSLWAESKKVDPTRADALQTEARNIKPIERYYYNVIVRQQHNPQTNEVEKNVGPKILSVGKTIHSRIIRAICGDEAMQEPALGDITHFQTGRDFKIVKAMRASGKDTYPNYSESRFLDPSPLGTPEQIQTWMGNLHNLVALRKVLAYEELHKQVRIYLGKEKDDTVMFDPNEFDEEAPTPTRVEQPVQTQPVQEAPVQQPVSTTQVEETENTQEEVVVNNDSESLADDDFIKELQGI